MSSASDPTPKSIRVFGSRTGLPGTPRSVSPPMRVEFDFGPLDDSDKDKLQKSYEPTAPDPAPIDLSEAVSDDQVFPQDAEEANALAEKEGLEFTRLETPQSKISIDFPLAPLRGFRPEAGALPWAVSQGGGFSTRAKAFDLVNRTLEGMPPDCGDVGVVVVDEGLSAQYIRHLGGRFGGGWQLLTGGAPSIVGRYSDPYSRIEDGHGNMIARNVLSQSPNATIYDAPVLPSRITNVEGYASDAKLLFDAIAYVIDNPTGDPRFPHHDHWIIVNAWGVATRFADTTGPVAYRNVREHRLNASIIGLSNLHQVDVVFAAGNSGVHDPARFAGPYDRGHGNSIWGANGLPEVFTIGAVRADGLPIGASSQGPAEARLLIDGDVNRKPDFSAPSWFSEDTDASISNTGTSAACAVFAGWLARIRSVHPNVTSDDLKSLLGADAPENWSPATGHTIRQPTNCGNSA